MIVKYFLAMFNNETWGEFLENDSSVYGTTLHKEKQMEKTSPGDFFICYVTKSSRIVGLLEIMSIPHLDDVHIWKSDIYPVRVKVRPIYTLKTENGVPISELKDGLTHFNGSGSRSSWQGFFRTSLNRFNPTDAKIIIEKLKQASNKQLF